MGSYAAYCGSYNISEDKQAVFVKQMLRVLDLGGMMETTEVQLFDQRLELLQPVREIKAEKVHFYFNYFEDRGWETASFTPKDTYLWTEKIGDAEFSDTITAAYMLYELYDPEYGFAIKDCDFVEASQTIGWLNHILGTRFSIGKRAHLWDCLEQDALSSSRCEIRRNALEDLVPCAWRNAVGGTELADLMFITNGTEHLTEGKVQKGTYADDVLKCKQELNRFFQSNSERDPLWELLEKSYAEREQEQSERLQSLAKLTLRMPARVFIYLTAEICKENFWKLWKDLHTKVYRDEQMNLYASAELMEWRRKRLQEPVPPVRTSDFLRQDGYFAFYDTPEELKGTPNYYLSDADRLYWWDGSDEVQVTAQTDAWLKELAERHKRIAESEKPESDSISGLQGFMKLLNEIDAYYWHIFPFESMFYDFVEHISQKEYAAAIELLRQTADAEENRKIGKVIQSSRYSDMKSKNATGNAGRIQIKRLYAVLANKLLRQKYFGF